MSTIHTFLSSALQISLVFLGSILFLAGLLCVVLNPKSSHKWYFLEDGMPDTLHQGFFALLEILIGVLVMIRYGGEDGCFNCGSGKDVKVEGDEERIASTKTNRAQSLDFSPILQVDVPQTRQPSSEIKHSESLDFSPILKVDIQRTRKPSLSISEIQLQQLWAEILGIKTRGTITEESNFFLLGGDPSSAANLVNAARNWGLLLTVEDVLERPKLNEMAERLRVGDEAREAKVMLERLLGSSSTLQEWVMEC